MKVKISEKPNINKIPMQGSDSRGNKYEVNSQYLIKNGKPILPVMGEFHFSRYPENEWEDEILKMRAGGVEILATYIFWIHHEENKGEWNFSGCRNIRKFLETCNELNMPVWLRIGPWAHGECRNGGYPDWLVSELHDNGLGVSIYGEPIHEARTNDGLYMEYVELFWERLSIEIKGMMCKDGGPVIGIQLENEYCHAGGPRDKSRGFEHMRTLKELALKFGFEAPYYTATGWGGAVVIEKEMLPVMGGYVDAPWAGHIKEMPACENFLMIPFHNDENIGADLKAEGDNRDTFSKDDNPYLTAELGGGLQATELRRTYPFGEDIEAQSICMLGAGANLLGYYMYHGGVNPDGADYNNPYATYQESKATGYFNNLPIKSYDFEAPIHESGKLNDSYGKLKKIHLMTRSFGESLAPASSYFPDEIPTGAEDMETPRVSVRYNHDTGEGFLFINNHQRLRKMKPIKGFEVSVCFENGKKIVISNINCEADSCMVIPFGLKIGGGRLVKTNAALLAHAGDNYYFYYDDAYNDEKPYFEYEGDLSGYNVILLTKGEAEKSYIFDGRLYISDRPLLEKNGEIYMLMGETEEKLSLYETDGEAVDIYVLEPEETAEASVGFRECDVTLAAKILELADCYGDEKAPEGCRVYEIDFGMKEAAELNEIYLHIDFNGDKAQLFAGGKMLTDWFSNGDDWSVALKRYGYPNKMQIVVYPFVEEVYYDLPPRKGCGLAEVRIEAEYKVPVGTK